MGAVMRFAAAAAVGALVSADPGRAQFSEHEYRYEPAVSVLVGALTTAERFGPPNYGESPGSDVREGIYLLKLDRSIFVIGEAVHHLNSESEEVSEIQLTRSSPRFGFEEFTGRRVRVTGELFHQHSDHHHTKVLMMVSKIEPE